MKTEQMDALQAFRRIRDFVDRSAPNALTGSINTQREALQGVIDRLSGHGVAQDGLARSSRAATQARRRAVADLRARYLRPVARLANVLAADNAQLHAVLTLPPRLAGVEALIAAAHAVAEVATREAAAFQAAGLAPDIGEQVRKAANVVREAVDTQAKERGRRTGSTEGVRAETQRGRFVVKLLDALVTPAIASDPVLLREWRALKRLTVKRGSPVEAPPAAEAA